MGDFNSNTFPFPTAMGQPQADTVAPAAPAAAPVTAPVAEAPAKKGSLSSPKFAPFRQAAMSELNKYKEAGSVDKLGSRSGDIVFQYMLGNPLNSDKRRVGTLKDPNGNVLKDANGKSVGKDEACSKGIGFVFKAVKDVSVPQVKGKKTCATGFNPEDVTEVTYKAGDTIILTYLELFLLAIRPEYSMRFGYEYTDEDGTKKIDPVGFRVDIKPQRYNKDTSKLPSPSPALVRGAVKDGMVDVCQKKANPSDPIVWTAPEYEAKFACFLQSSHKASVNRDAAAKDKRDNSLEVAAICRAIVGDYVARGE